MVRLFAIIMLLIGFSIKYFIGRRRFNRRAIGGMEMFKSYEKAIIVSLLEWILSVVAAVLILAGILFFALDLYDRWEGKQRRLKQQEEQKKSEVWYPPVKSARYSFLRSSEQVTGEKRYSHMQGNEIIDIWEWPSFPCKRL